MNNMNMSICLPASDVVGYINTDKLNCICFFMIVDHNASLIYDHKIRFSSSKCNNDNTVMNKLQNFNI